MTSWTLADVLDFEHYLAQPAVETGELGTPSDDRRTLFHAWLDRQRTHEAGVPSPGAGLRSARSMLALAAWAVGGLAGAAVSGTWLATGRGEPVNAPLFWAATVGLQIVLVAGTLLAWLLRGHVTVPSGGQAVLRAAWLRIDGAARRLPGERREALRAAWGRLALRGGAYRGLLAAPVLALAQRFGCAFNLGLLAAMLAWHLPLTDLRFGWQSTYDVTPEQVHRAVDGVATPWRWLEPAAQPTRDDIAATRYAAGVPVPLASAAASRAWWPFLAWSIAVYGLLPRAMLLAGFVVIERWRLSRLRFDHPEANALWRRLTGPLVRAQGGTAQLPDGDGAAAPHGHRGDGGPCVAFVAEDVAQADDVVAVQIGQRWGWRIARLHRGPIDDRAAVAGALTALPGETAALIAIVPASRDPIVAVARALRVLLDAARPGVEVLVLLTDADAARLAIWRRFVLGQRLAIGVEAFDGGTTP